MTKGKDISLFCELNNKVHSDYRDIECLDWVVRIWMQHLCDLIEAKFNDKKQCEHLKAAQEEEGSIRHLVNVL